jgi:hypothetical protein
LINLAFFAVSPRKTTATVDARKQGDAQRGRDEVTTILANCWRGGAERPRAAFQKREGRRKHGAEA